MNGYGTPTGLMGQSPGQQHLSMNSYGQDLSGSGSMYSGGPAYVPPMQFHLTKTSQLAPKNLGVNQRVASQLYVSERIREEMHRRQEATVQRLDSKLSVAAGSAAMR